MRRVGANGARRGRPGCAALAEAGYAAGFRAYARCLGRPMPPWLWPEDGPNDAPFDGPFHLSIGVGVGGARLASERDACPDGESSALPWSDDDVATFARVPQAPRSSCA